MFDRKDVKRSSLVIKISYFEAKEAASSEAWTTATGIGFSTLRAISGWDQDTGNSSSLEDFHELCDFINL